MADPLETHPLAPEIETAEERAENTTEAVNLRSGIVIGPMRYVLGIGILLAIAAMVAAFFLR